jgi:hypothetical protein
MIDEVKIAGCKNIPKVKQIQHTAFGDFRGQLSTHYSESNEREILNGKTFNHS